MTTNEKIRALREAMCQAGADACCIPTSDEHMSEYLPDHWKCRAWASGFTGSAGTLVITRTASALWTDGRYFIQAARQIEGSEIELMRMREAGVPTVEEYLEQSLPQNGVLALDGSVCSAAGVSGFCKLKKAPRILDADLITPLWTQDRPAVPASEVYALGVEYAGKTAAEKLAEVRRKLSEKGTDSILLSSLDSIAWLLNIRAADIAYNPFALAFCYVGAQSAVLFINTARVPDEVRRLLAGSDVTLREYDEVTAFMQREAAGRLLLDSETTSYRLAQAIAQNAAVQTTAGSDPVQALKGVKNETEIRCLKNSHIKDGVAMVRFQRKLEQAMQQGQTVTELDVDAWLRELRAAQPLNIGESFDTIAAYGANAAMMHYSAKPDSFAVLQPRGFLLVDSGAQYLDGTTDITRTYALGELTDREKTFYTLVLKSHIDLALTVFMKGCTGGNIDIMAREAVWRNGIDYRCGTGHGVGFVGGVHEGPQNLRINNNVAFVPGMTVTDEPGIYEEGEVGIRIENELLCVEKMHTEYGDFYGFEPFTYCPIDLAPVLPALLDERETEWLDLYHSGVYRTLEPLLTEEERAWLREKTMPLKQYQERNCKGE